ncbi:MAG: hypothetical protein TEF_22005 [Rhizobiales bacterium NRL2]|jgi:hypothetical protein|nr:MAG: hypothetical protein TEF_22005 [Rhizobiales bacterium NRL2]
MIDPFAAIERHLPRIGAWGIAVTALVALGVLASTPQEAPVSATAATAPVSRPQPADRDGCLTMPDGLYVCDDGEND